MQVGPGDEVILSAYDYPGNFLAIHAVGAHPVLADVDARSWNLAPAAVALGLGPKSKAIIACHLHGGIVDMPALMLLAGEAGVAVIEDAAQSPAALVQGRRAGTWGTAGVLSFGGSKLLTAGRGGALLTREPAVFQRARRHLIRGNSVAPLSELQAAVLLPQLARLDVRNAHRAAQVHRLRNALQDIPGIRLFENVPGENEPAYYKLGMQFVATAFGLPRERFVAALRAEGMAFDEGFNALHIGRSPSRFRGAGDLSEATSAHHGVVVLHHPVLLGTDTDVDQVAAAVRKVYLNADRLRR